MPVLKCKMCGGDLEIAEEMSVCECEYCGTKQTVPSVDNEKKITLFSRANRLRSACDFDKAAGVYESIVAEFPEEAEAYWGLILCKYGIEYVDDPDTAKKIPTCHRSSFDCVLEDTNFEMVMENADSVARSVYREEAKYIEVLRTSIIEVSSKEEPYDIFICYKETAEDGQRTIDSVIAQDVYDALTEKGYRVFFARITLEDKLGQEYEPYIFAALHSAKVMLAFGTDYEYYNAVWVKNEWSRFLSLIEKGEKKTLIPCYKDIDAYDMPAEFKRLQAQDMGKVGAMQDLVRGIGKIIGEKNTVVTQETVINATNTVETLTPTMESLLKRAFMFLVDGEWENANEYCEKVLDINPECVEAYLGKMMVDLRVRKEEDIFTKKRDFLESKNYGKLIRLSEEWHQKLLESNNRYEKQYEEQYENSKKRNELVQNSFSRGAKLYITKLDGTIDCNDRSGRCHIKEWSDIEDIVACKDFTIGLKKDGTVVVEGEGESNVEAIKQWQDIVAIETDGFTPNHIIGLKRNGTLEILAKYTNQIYEVSEWKNIKKVVSCFLYAAGLKEDGSVIVTTARMDRLNKRVKSWRNIIDIAAIRDKGSNACIVGLQADGMVVFAEERNGSNPQFYGTDEWQNIQAIAVGRYRIAGLRTDGTIVISGKNNDAFREVLEWQNIQAIAFGEHCEDDYIVGLKTDGTVVCSDVRKNLQCAKLKGITQISCCADVIFGKDAMENTFSICDDVHEWEDIVSVVSSDSHTIGLKKDGTVVSCGSNSFNECEVDEWKDIIAVGCGNKYTAGVTKDGKVLLCGDEIDKYEPVKKWTDIIDITCDNELIVGLKKDGSVVSYGKSLKMQHDTSNWENVVSVVYWNKTIIGLNSDGSVYTSGDDARIGHEWSDLIAITSSKTCLVRLKSDGRVSLSYTTFHDRDKWLEVYKWRDIIAIGCDDNIIVGLKADGTLVKCGETEKYTNINDIKLFNSIDTIEEEIVTAKKLYEEKKLIKEEKIAKACHILEEQFAKAQAECIALKESKMKEMQLLKEQKATLQEQRKALGIFQTKEKKIIDTEIQHIESTLYKLEEELNKL